MCALWDRVFGLFLFFYFFFFSCSGNMDNSEYEKEETETKNPAQLEARLTVCCFVLLPLANVPSPFTLFYDTTRLDTTGFPPSAPRSRVAVGLRARRTATVTAECRTFGAASAQTDPQAALSPATWKPRPPPCRKTWKRRRTTMMMGRAVFGVKAA